MKRNLLKNAARVALLFFLTVPLESFAQNEITVTGTIKSETEEPMPGVNVLVKGTTDGTSSDSNGNYTLQVPSSTSILVFSFIGYATQEVVVQGRETIDVQLEVDLISLGEVVVIGYGTQRKQDVTTAVDQISPEEFVPGAVRNVGELLRGKVAGLTISTPSGDPEANAEILLRGITSIRGSSSPLVLIDGFPGDLNVISPNDIEDVSILKDASAAAIYGARGKNGVILITTKKSEGAAVLDYSTYISTERFQRKANFIDAGGMRELIKDGWLAESSDRGTDSDWLGLISRKPVNHFHNLSLRGGTKTTQYVANASYQNAQGIFKGSDNEEFKLRLDLTQFLFDDKLKINVNVLKGLRDYSSFDNAAYRQALIRNPTDSIRTSDGSWTERVEQFQYANPGALVAERIYDDNIEWTWLTGAVSYFPVQELELKVSGSQHLSSGAVGIYETKQHYSTVSGGRNGTAYISNWNSKENYLDLTANFNKTIEEHRLSAVLAYSYVDQTNYGASMYNFDFPTDKFSYHDIGLGRALRADDPVPGPYIDSYKNDWKLIGFLGRVGYGFKNKYNLLASLRYEGSSRFGDDQKWGLFPSISAGWILKNEAFLSDIDLISSLKLRAGFGQSGSIATNPYTSLNRYAYSQEDFYFDGQKWVSILQPASNYNPNLGWETNTEFNIGLDFGILGDRVAGTIDYYDRRIEDLVYDYPVPQPPNMVGITTANAAAMTNKGIEIGVDILAVQEKGFQWRTNVLYSSNKNELTSLSSDEFKLENDFIYDGYTGDPIQLATHKIEVGKPIGSFFGYKSIGLQEDPNDPGRGVWLIEGADGEAKLLTEATEADRQILGNGLPQWYLSWNNYFTFGRFDLNVTMRGAFDYQILNFQRMFYENPTIAYNKLEDAYRPIDGLILKSPQAYVSHYIEDGDFWKIDNLTLGYKIPAERFGVKNARVYVSGSNLAVITKYKGIDPEVRRTGLSPGNDERDKYPTTRTFTLGLNFTL